MSEDSFQKYARVASGSSRIPVKDKRHVSTPIAMDDSLLNGVKRSSIPRMASPVSSASTPPHNNVTTRRKGGRASLSPLINVVNTEAPKLTSTPQSRTTLGSPSTPPSTVTRLSSQLAQLSIQTPSKPPKEPTPPRRIITRSATTQSLSNVQAAMDKKKTQNTRNLGDALNLTDNKLEDRTSTLLKSRIRSGTLQNHPSPSPVKKTVTRKASSQAIPSPVKRVASNTVRPRQPTASDDSPLLSRLTRSTTAFNLKAASVRRATRTVSEVSASSASTHATSNIPQNKSIPITKRAVSEKPADSIRRPTRSSRLKQEASVMNLNAKIHSTIQESSTTTPSDTLNIPKKRSMTKSFSVNVGLKDLTQASKTIPQPHTQKRVVSTRPRPLSTIYTPRVSSRSTTPQQQTSNKCKSPEDLHRLLLDFTGTKKSVQEWDSTLEVTSKPRLSPYEALTSLDLTTVEKAEITKSLEVFYLDSSGNRSYDPSNFGQNFGFDDKDKNLIVKANDQVNYRYQVIDRLGTGMFGKVYKCHDHKQQKLVSLKIMRNDPAWSLQSINEIKVLKQLHHENLLAYIDYFNFRSHICITTELLSVTLLEALEATKFKGFDISVIKLWSKQLLSGLEFMHERDIIHGDLKPENIMLCSPHSFDLKIIDFGSSTTAGNVTFPYIQSRFYRAPEVLLGCRYDTKIDIWSFITLIFEMYTGEPLFEAKDEENLYKLIVKLIGHPTAKTIISLRNEVFQLGSINRYNDPEYIDKKTMIFTKFDRIGTYKGLPLDQPRRDQSMQRKLRLDHAGFAQFLQSTLVWNPHDRPDATKLLKHEFVLEF